MATYDEAGRTPPGIEPKKATSDKDILKEVRERLKKCIDDHQELRARQKDDLLFSTLDQWPSGIRQAREGDPNGPRPCLTIDQINQYIVQVVNDMRQNKPAVKVRPCDDEADVGTAEVFQGIVRQIEDQSQAQVAYATAAESAVRVGEGYFRIITEYESEESFDQVIKIKRVPDMFCVYLGPHEMPDGSDAEYGFIFEWMPIDKFRRHWPKAKYTQTEFDELQTDYVGNWWDDGKICVAEYFYFDWEKQTITSEDGSATRETRIKTVKWCKLTGVEVLEKQDWAGKYIPIVKEVGKESWVNGKRVLWGLVFPAKDALRMYNYVISSIVERFALAPKAPFIGAVGQFEGVEDKWQQANTANFPYLEYNPVDVQGIQVPPPQRQQPTPVEVAFYQFLETARLDVQSSLGMYKAALGKEQPNQSGKAILALTRESDTGTFHFADNQRVSIEYCGRILIDLIPKIYDTNRIVKILGEDGKLATAQIAPEGPAMLNVPQPDGRIQSIYNLNVGTYDVTATVGPSFNTKRMEAATLFTDLANTSKDPITGTVMRYLAIKNSDFNGAEHAASMMEKLLPPGLIEQDGQPQMDPRAAAVINQLKQALQIQGQELQKLQTGEKAKELKVQADHDAKMKQIALETQEAQAQAELERQKAAAEAQLSREKAEAEIQLKRWVAEQEANLEREKVSAEVGIKQHEVETDRAVQFEKVNIEKQKMEKEVENENEVEAKKLAPKIEKSMSDITKKLEAPKPSPKSLNRKRDKDGNLVSITVKMDDGTTKEISVH